jgi:thiol-disulfide isomerase/thioredoxin
MIIRIVVILSALTCFVSCSNRSQDKKEEVDKPIPIVDFEGIKPFLGKQNDTTYVINFWATWCAPCVKEIPYFEQLVKEFPKAKLKVILINLDFSNHYETRLLPFVEKFGLKSTIIMLDDPDSNRWIDLVNPNWSGAIPATLIYNKTKREFFEKEFTNSELKDIVETFLNAN